MSERKAGLVSGGEPAAPVRSRGPLSALGVTGIVFGLVLLAGVGLGAGISPHPSGPFAKCVTSTTLAPRTYTAPSGLCISKDRHYTAVIQTTQGSIGISFLGGPGRVAANNFIVLAANGYFNGLAFFKSQTWSIQSGDPTGTGRGGPGYTIPTAAPISGDQWAPGSLGMAQLSDGNLSGGQFFITKAAWPGGNPTTSYDHFANVTSGIDVLGQLTAADRVVDVVLRAS